MPNPTKYQPSYSFTSWQASNPARPLPGQRVDIELQALQLTTDEIIAGLNQIRRSDGKLAGGIVDLASLSDEVRKKLGGGGGSGGPIDIDDVTGLQAELDALDDFRDSKNEPGGLASLGPDGKVPAAQLPTVAAPDTKDKLTWYVSDLDIPVGDPNRDDRPKLLALAATVIAAGGGRIVVDVPIRISGAWRFEKAQDIEIMGRGPGSIEVIPNANNPAIAAIRFISSTRVYVHDIRIFASDTAARGNIGFATDAHQCSHVRMERIHATNMMTGPWFGRCDYVWVGFCTIINPRADGIHFALGSQWCTGYHNHVEGQNDDCYASTSDKADQATIGLPFRRTKNISWIGNTAGAGTWGCGIVAYETDTVLIEGNMIRDQGGTGIAVSLHDDPDAASTDVSIIGNTIKNPGRAQTILGQPGQPAVDYQSGCGIFVNDGNSVLVSGNKISGVTANPSANKAGILVENGSQIGIKGNRVFNVNGTGIAFSGSCTDIDIHDNDIDFTQKSGIDSQSLGTQFAGYLSIKGNTTRRAGLSSGYSWFVDGSAAGAFIMADNIDEQLKAPLVTGALSSIFRDNLPTVWAPYNAQIEAQIGSSMSKSNEAARCCYEGGHFVVQATVTVNSTTGFVANLRYSGAGINQGVATLYCGADNTFFQGRHRDSYPGSYSFWGGFRSPEDGSKVVVPTYAGLYKLTARVPLN